MLENVWLLGFEHVGHLDLLVVPVDDRAPPAERQDGVELGGVGLLVVLGPVELLHVRLEIDGVTRRGEKTSGPPSLAIGM